MRSAQSFPPARKGGLQGDLAETAIDVAAFAARYDDAGIGVDGAGILRLLMLDACGIAGATVAAMSARIGERNLPMKLACSAVRSAPQPPTTPSPA